MGECSGELEWEALTETILGCAIKVQRSLGPGLLESAYETCLAYELEQAGLDVHRQVPLDITYGEILVPAAYRLDLLVENRVVLELKTVDRLTDFHEAQLLTYLRFSGKRIGLLLNFWRWPMKDGGIKRLLNPKAPPLASGLPLPSAF
ncbi:GxxExxY protein [Geothrix sp. 21YS21S-4]|uniref:GxxExxY protein n=1 Tax=Geothrix sp. 21YS21S-4 TaxID=3068889 RepID=UPI0027BA07B9|nr:GxxExxY protein [Geothrix sp. 21YS21S-4]